MAAHRGENDSNDSGAAGPVIEEDFWASMMDISDNEVWGIIPARGGSKSIPFKNMALLHGRSLMEYVVEAGKASKRITRLICSTDDDRIASFCRKYGVEIHRRPKELAQDDTPVHDVIIHLLTEIGEREGQVAGILLLLQPTSPFLLPEHIDRCVDLLIEDPDAESAQSISQLPHNHHAFNQRVIEGQYVRFKFSEDRKRCYNKQTKPTFYIFGNILVMRTSTLLEKKDLFGDRSCPFVIPFHYALDVDGPDDLELAEWLLERGRVQLPHLRKG